ncbi:uncharacterized protein RCO7_07986 [Rhynchosporium graminicola]|uniref:Nephrocystin 3-like N-terminal domain-containing protein n=1 Tax=Rhynchosporium graminicola TaxID=2792576 RepID=A0A1E1LQ46_9HELO|nr:uncharacterized protein RCO7_07986 [Rhynchosporium commune]
MSSHPDTSLITSALGILSFLRNFKNLKRNRESVLQSSEPSPASADAFLKLQDQEEERRRASEPTIATNSPLSQQEVAPIAPLLQHQITPGSSFSRVRPRLYSLSTSRPQVEDPDGLSLVHDCDAPLADLIFVHGLGGSSRKTWSFERDIKNFWPPWLGTERGFLNTRIFLFGYNAHFVRKYQFKHPRLRKGPSVSSTHHPMIFVVHSMGGLVLKKAYIIGKTDEQFAGMMKQTYGIVFLGTPHRGSNLAVTLNNILRASPALSAKIYINEIDKDSTTISDINEQFRNICGGLNLVSFHETLETSIGLTKAMVVERDSAILGYPGEISAPLRADHHGLTKFKDRADVDYRDVRNVLRSFLRKIQNPETPPGAASPVTCAVSLDQLLGIKIISDDLDAIKQRRSPHSCQWILRKPSFRDWAEELYEEGPKLYWITGPPTVGKLLYQALSSIAIQVAEVHEGFKAALVTAFLKNGMSFVSQKYQVIWEKIFEGILFCIKFDEPLFWVLDGVDEAESPGTICDLMININSATPIKILLVSRPTRDLTSALSTCKYLHHEPIHTKDTADDIQAHVHKRVARIIPEDIKDQRAQVIESILSKANGSFLWVELALERVDDNWYTPDDIHRALDGIPTGMDKIYSRMAESVASQDTDELPIALDAEFNFGNTRNLEEAIVDVCGNFVVVKHSKVALIHQTARAFLVEERAQTSISIDRHKCHEYMAIVCMNFLSNASKWKEKFSFAQDAISTSGQQSPSHVLLLEPFLWYATTYWASHVSCAPANLAESKDLELAVFEFLDKHALLWINAIALGGNLR